MDTDKRKGTNTVFKTVMTIIATSIITFVITTILLYSQGGKKDTETVIGDAAKSGKLSAKLSIIRNKIDSEYVGNINEDDLIEGAVKGYVSGLNDVYTEYLTVAEMTEFTEDTTGEYVGIGVYMTKDTANNQILIYSTIKDSPAQKVGLMTGDIIVSVDDEECNGDNYDTITSKIKGKEGTKVKIGIIREQKEMTFEIERKKIEVQHITSEVLENDIGYIYISSFEGNVATQFEKAFNELKEKRIKSLIIDIRNNGGGIVTESLDIADMMTGKGENLLIELDKNGKEEIKKSKKDKQIDMPIVLLVNEYSASASEILAGILKENVENATLIGNTTYGKGVIQTLYTLSDNSGIKITTNEYFTPNHNKINKIGVEPDIKITDYTFTGDIDIEDDSQLKKAIETLKK